MSASFLSWLWLHSESKTLISFFSFLSFCIFPPVVLFCFTKSQLTVATVYLQRNFLCFPDLTLTNNKASKQTKSHKENRNFPPLFFYRIPTNSLKNYPTKIFMLGSLSHSFFFNPFFRVVTARLFLMHWFYLNLFLRLLIVCCVEWKWYIGFGEDEKGLIGNMS